MHSKESYLLEHELFVLSSLRPNSRGMSFSIPHNHPDFTSHHRANENVYWGSAGRTHQNGHANHGIGNSLNGLFENKSLPMYKDKPYSYAASRRQAPWYKRPGVWLAFAVLSLLNFYLFWAYLRPSVRAPVEGDHDLTNRWDWLKKSGDTTADWDLRREAVKDAFKLSWDGYANHAWGVSSCLSKNIKLFNWSIQKLFAN